MRPDLLYHTLERYIVRLYQEFLKDYIKKTPSLRPSNAEIDNIKAFCVLSHAAFEEYFEKIVMYRISEIYDFYDNNSFLSLTDITDLQKSNDKIKKILSAVILLVSYTVYTKETSDSLTKHKSKIEELKKVFSTGVFTAQDASNFLRASESYSKDIIKESKKFMEDKIEDSHGVSLKYLLKILIPVGLNISTNLNYQNSLLKLSKYRGEYAHSFESSISAVVSPPDIKNYVLDCLKLSKELKDTAKFS